VCLRLLNPVPRFPDNAALRRRRTGFTTPQRAWLLSGE